MCLSGSERAIPSLFQPFGLVQGMEPHQILLKLRARFSCSFIFLQFQATFTWSDDIVQHVTI